MNPSTLETKVSTAASPPKLLQHRKFRNEQRSFWNLEVFIQFSNWRLSSSCQNPNILVEHVFFSLMYVCSWNLMRYEDTDAIGWCDWNTYRNWHRVTLDCPIAILLTCESGKLYFACIIDTLVSPFCLQFFSTDVCIKILKLFSPY